MGNGPSACGLVVWNEKCSDLGWTKIKIYTLKRRFLCFVSEIPPKESGQTKSQLFTPHDQQLKDFLGDTEQGEDTAPDLEDLKAYIKQEQKTKDKYLFSDDDFTVQGDDPNAYYASHYSTQYHDNTPDQRANDPHNMDRDKKGRGRGRGHRKNGRRRNKGRNRRPPPPVSANLVLDDSAGDDPRQLNEVENAEDLNSYIYNQRPAAAENVKFRSCEELRCHAGGRCVRDEMRGGVRCQCQLGQAGEFCEQGQTPDTRVFGFLWCRRLSNSIVCFLLAEK